MLHVKGDCQCLVGSSYTKIGPIQRRLAWALSKDDMQIRIFLGREGRKEERLAVGSLLRKMKQRQLGALALQTLVFNIS